MLSFHFRDFAAALDVALVIAEEVGGGEILIACFFKLG